MKTLKEDFEKVDIDKNGNLNLEEFIEFHRYGGMEEDQESEEDKQGFMDDIKHMFGIADKNKDESVTFDEYIHYLDNVDEEIKQREL